MSLCYFVLNKEDYSWKNALLWGNCREHGKKMGYGCLSYRAIHCITAAGELLPIVGQVISIFEKVIITNFFNPPSKISMSVEIGNISNPGVEKESDEEMKRLFLEKIKNILISFPDIEARIQYMGKLFKEFTVNDDADSIQTILSNDIIQYLLPNDSNKISLMAAANWQGCIEGNLITAARLGYVDILHALLSNENVFKFISQEVVKRIIQISIDLRNIEVAKEISQKVPSKDLNTIMRKIITDSIQNVISSYKNYNDFTSSNSKTLTRYMTLSHFTDFTLRLNFILDNKFLTDMLNEGLGEAILICINSNNEDIHSNISRLLADPENVATIPLNSCVAIFMRAINNPPSNFLKELINDKPFVDRTAPQLGVPILNALLNNENSNLRNIIQVLSDKKILKMIDKVAYGKIFQWAATNQRQDIIDLFDPSISLLKKNPKEKSEDLQTQDENLALPSVKEKVLEEDFEDSLEGKSELL